MPVRAGNARATRYSRAERYVDPAMRSRRQHLRPVRDLFWVDVDGAQRIAARTRECRAGSFKSLRHEWRLSLGVVSISRSSERAPRPADSDGAEALVADALAALRASDELLLDVGVPRLEEGMRPRVWADSGAELAAVLKPVLAAASTYTNSIDDVATLLQEMATMNPDAVRLAHRARVWHQVLRRAGEYPGYVLIEGCAWEVSDDETLELSTVRDSVTDREVPAPPGLGVLAHLDPDRGHHTRTGEATLRSGASALRVDVLGRPCGLTDLRPELLVLLQLDVLAIWSTS